MLKMRRSTDQSEVSDVNGCIAYEIISYVISLQFLVISKHSISKGDSPSGKVSTQEGSGTLYSRSVDKHASGV